MADPRPTDPAPIPGGAAAGSRGAAAETLADLGEWELIRRLGAFAPPGQFSDDAALVPLQAPRPVAGSNPSRADGALVVNTDVLVEGIHFSDATTAAADVGWRAAAANLSDLAAMGCTEGLGLTVGLVAPGDTPWPWVEGVYLGISEALGAHGGVLLGGDCSSGAQRLLAVTAIGRLLASPTDRMPPTEGTAQGHGRDAGLPLRSAAWAAIRRSDGRPGDALVCTGPHGLSRLGLALLQGELAGLDSDLMQRAIRAHQRPTPRFDAVRALIACRPEGLAWRVGGCDSSDGLAAAAGALAAASGCAARLDRRRLPLDPAMAALPQAEAWCLNGGEDFELVLALEPSWAEALLAALPGSSRFGELVGGDPGALSWADGGTWGAEEAAAWPGYSHFS